METPLSTEVIGLMLNNLLLEAGIVNNSVQGILLGHTTKSIHKNREGCGDSNIFNISKSKKSQENSLLNFAQNISSIDSEYVSTSTIKAEPEVENFEIENVPLETINCYSTSAFSQPDDNTTSCLTQNKAQLKSETTSDIEKISEIVYEEWKIKNEELDIKEDLEPEGTSLVEPRVIHVIQSNTNSTINAVIKKQPGKEIVDKENVPLNGSTANISRGMLEPELIVQLEKLNVVERNGTFVVNHSHRADVDSLVEPHVKHATQTITTTINALIRKEPGRENVKRKNVPLNRSSFNIFRSKPEPELIVRLEKLNVVERNGKFVVEHSCRARSTDSILSAAFSRDMPRHSSKESHECSGRTVLESNSRNKLHGTVKSVNDRVKKCHRCKFKCCCQHKFKCSECKYQTCYSSHLKNHLFRHMNPEDVKKFKCNNCDYRTFRKGSLKSHMLRHADSEDVKKLKCNDCAYRTIRKRDLKQHMLLHVNSEDVKKFKCNNCAYRTFRKSDLKNHLLLHARSEDVKKFKCNDCDYVTTRKCYLMKHILRHINSEDVKKFKCNECDFRTIYKDYLKTHMLQHASSEDVKKFKCNNCDYRTIRKSHLKLHLQRHINPDVKKFKCNDCDYLTMQRCALKQHIMLSHINKDVNNLKTLKCNNCDYRTFRKCDLKRHLLLHVNSEDVKKFKCNDCNYRTSRKYCIKTHMMHHINSKQVRKFKCD